MSNRNTRLVTRRRTSLHYFTLVELLVVIAIITVLASMLTPALRKSLDTVRQINCCNNFRQIGQASSGYINDYDGSYPPYSQCSTGHINEMPGYCHVLAPYLGGDPLPADMGMSSFSEDSGTATRLATRIWRCPGNRTQFVFNSYRMMGHRTHKDADNSFVVGFGPAYTLPYRGRKTSEIKRNCIYMSEGAGVGGSNFAPGAILFNSQESNIRAYLEDTPAGVLVGETLHPGMRWNYLFSDFHVEFLMYTDTGSNNFSPMWRIR